MADLKIKDENVVELLDKRFVHVYDLQYAEGKHYYDCSRRPREKLMATKTKEERQKALPDAVSCFLIIRTPEEEPRLFMFREYRYPTGQFILSIPAGLIDEHDGDNGDPIITSMIRELHEETGIVVKDTDRIFTINRLAYCSPGLTDESTALVGAVIDLDDLSTLNQNGAEGSELFDGYALYTKDEVRRIIEKGTDECGDYYPLVTWSAMMYFLSDLWK